MSASLDRRRFLKLAGASTAGLLLGIHLGQPASEAAPVEILRAGEPLPEGEFAPNVFLQIDSSGTVTIFVPRSEMGQGVQTALPVILADELEADWSKVRMEQAPANRAYGNQVTGGSRSITESYGTLRKAGALARTLLITAAAQQWGVDPTACYAFNGEVLHRDSDRRLSYGDLAAAAARLEVPKNMKGIPLKDPADFRLIGQRRAQATSPDIVTGTAQYGSDIQVPGMLVAVVARCPIIGGKVASFDPAPALAVPGVRRVAEIKRGVAVVADTTWAALRGRDALVVQWDEGPNTALSSAGIAALLEAEIQKARDSVTPGDPAPAQVIEAVYDAPYLAHTTMEPMNAAADARPEFCEVWAPTQDRARAASVAQSKAGVKTDQVTLHVPLIGCGSGRRLEVDYVEEAVELSRAVGEPVRVFWTREDDIHADYFRPGSLHWLRAELDDQGVCQTFDHHIASQGIYGADAISQGATPSYHIHKKLARPHLVPLPIPVTYWRSVYNTQNAYAVECFIDEVAAAAGADPFEYRRAMLDEGERLRGVLELAAEKANWGSALPAGVGRGIACHNTWGATPVAMVAEVSVSAAGAVRVQRVVCAVDCGLPINPDMIDAQMEGGIVYSLSAALYGEVTFDGGRVQQGNFHDYPLLRIDEMPAVEVYIVPSTEAPQGIGEMGVPPALPAILNAIYAATGKRIRRLPIRAKDLKG